MPRLPLSAAPALLLLPGLFAGCASSPVPSAPPPATTVRAVQILHTNDFHGRILPRIADGDSIGGSPGLAAHFDSLRVRFPGPTLLLSAGDVMQGTALSNITWGQASIDMYNRKGYTAAALGNHEFDWGIDTLRARVAESRFPWLGANLFLAGTDRHPEWVRPWVIVEEKGVRVGVVGVTLSSTPLVVMAGRVDGLEFRDEGEAIDRYVPELRALGVDFVVAVGHEGAYCRSAGEGPGELSQGCEGRAVEILEGLRHPPDLFLAGHTHLRNLTEVGGVPLVQNPAYSGTFSVTVLERGGPEDGVRAVLRELRVPRLAEVTPDSAVARLVGEWAAEVTPLLRREVAVLAVEMSNAERLPVENEAGNLLADAQRFATGAEVALVNNGGLRRSLPSGRLTYEVLYEFQPFQNDLVVVELSGAQLRETLEFALTEDGSPWAHISGIRVEVDPAAPVGGRIRRVLRDDGSVVRDADMVTLGTTEFVATGGDGFRTVAEGRRRSTGIIDLDGLIDYLRSFEGPVPAPAMGRWVRLPPD